ncbi:flavin-containing amine oxidase [Hyaloraphidium curvatum]|nr:flavin-containing amine oxidase [Hyaloraphidium curvatum]
MPADPPSSVNSSSEPIVDVVVVGGGISGLAAARRVRDAGLSVLVLEAQDHLGGRLQRALVSSSRRVNAAAAELAAVVTGSTADDLEYDMKAQKEERERRASVALSADGTASEPVYLDLGGQWMGETHHLLKELTKELGIPTFPTPHSGRDVFLFEKQKVVLPDGTVMPLSLIDNVKDAPEAAGIPLTHREPINAHSVRDLAEAWTEIEALAKELDPRAPWLHPMADVFDSKTLSTWLGRNVHSALGSWWIQSMNRMGGSGGYEPNQASFLHALWCQRVAPQRENPESYLLDGGCGQLPQKLVEMLPPGTVRLDSPVVKIEQHELKRPGRPSAKQGLPPPPGAAVTLTIVGGERFHARQGIIVAMPPHVAGTIIYDPPVPPAREQLTQRAPMGTIVKILAVFDKPFWLEDGLSGTAMGNLSTLEFVADSTNTLRPNAPGVLASFIVGKAGLKHLELSPQRRRLAIEDDLAAYFGRERVKEHLVDVIEGVWPANQFVGGAFTSFFGPGVWTAYGDAMWRPVGRVFWAGTEASTRWPGYIEGALEAGYEAADMVAELAKAEGAPAA